MAAFARAPASTPAKNFLDAFSIIEELGRESGEIVDMIKQFIASGATILPRD